MEEKTLKETIKENSELMKQLLENPKVKKVKLKKLSKAQQKKGFVNYLFINENKNLEMLKVPVDEMTTFLDKTPRLAQPDSILFYKGSPTIIQPAWSIRPFSPIDNYQKTKDDGELSIGFKLLANRAELGEVKSKKRLSGGAIFAIIVVLIVVGYLLLS